MTTVDITAIQAAKTVDARGSACPGPLLEAKWEKCWKSGRVIPTPKSMCPSGRPKSGTSFWAPCRPMGTIASSSNGSNSRSLHD